MCSLALAGSSYVALVNGQLMDSVTFTEDGEVLGLDLPPTAGKTGLYLVHEGRDVPKEDHVSGLFLWDSPDEETAPAKHHGNPDASLVLSPEDNVFLLYAKNEVVDRARCIGGLPSKFQHYKTRCWKEHSYTCPSPMHLLVRHDLSEIGFVKVGDGCWVSFDERSYFPLYPAQVKTICLMERMRYQQHVLANKYDLHGFKDRLDFDEAKQYAVDAIVATFKLIGKQAVVDVGSGTVAVGPFHSASLRQMVCAGKWLALDPAAQHFEANKADPTLEAAAGDICTYSVYRRSLAVAKDSLNNLCWGSLVAAVQNMRRCGIRHILVNDQPGFSNASRQGELMDEDVFTYRHFDMAGEGIGLRRIATFEPQDNKYHPGKWCLYSL